MGAHHGVVTSESQPEIGMVLVLSLFTTPRLGTPVHRRRFCASRGSTLLITAQLMHGSEMLGAPTRDTMGTSDPSERDVPLPPEYLVFASRCAEQVRLYHRSCTVELS